MVPDPHYGSSEYSGEAEELFARFVLQHERGEDPDFEALCDEHPELADELYGLHADWDNVRSLLARLEGKRAAAASVDGSGPGPAGGGGDATPSAPTSVAHGAVEQEENLPGSTSGTAPWSGAGRGHGTGAADAVPERTSGADHGPAAASPVGAGAEESWSAGEHPAAASAPAEGIDEGGGLPERPFTPGDIPERDTLERRAGLWRRVAVAAAIGAAALAAWTLDLHRARTVLADESRGLRAERETVRGELAEAERLATELDRDRQRLDEELGRTREEREALAGRSTALERDLAAERDRGRALAEEQEALARQLAEEREEARAAAAEARRLALRVELEELLREERALWPSGPDTAERLAAWLERARDLAARAENAGAGAIAPELAGDGSGAPRRLAAAERRLERLRACEAALDDPLWQEVARALDGTSAAGSIPRHGLRPLGRDADTGLWRFADLRTDAGAAGRPLEFLLVLVPEPTSAAIEPFLVAALPWTEEARRGLLGTPVEAAGLDAEARRALDLALLGYRDPSAAQVVLARRRGVDLAPWSEQPVLPLASGR